MLKINSNYTEYFSAIRSLREIGIDLSIIETNSPFKLATTNNPEIVISKQANLINGEFPNIKFVVL